MSYQPLLQMLDSRKLSPKVDLVKELGIVTFPLICLPLWQTVEPARPRSMFHGLILDLSPLHMSFKIIILERSPL
jgi:hypothetical protein